ncbi:MAG: DsbA family protein [Deltaproteobacteria bacterium]|nr:DsbA family protein [Deltaproteobacteria bacterium]
MKNIVVAMFAVVFMSGSVSVFAADAVKAPAVNKAPAKTTAKTPSKSMTEETGQEILKELKAIREALEKRPAAAPQQAAPQPQPTRGKVSIKGSNVLGNKKAPITLVEFTDYQCPFCKRFYDTTFADLKKNFIDTGKVKFVSRNLPLSFHSNARKAAEAALCAGEQDKYWEMREKLFTNQAALEVDKLRVYAKELSLNEKKFNACLDANKGEKIDADTNDAGTIGIRGTPSFVLAPSSGGDDVEGEIVVGAQPYSAFEAKINELLKAADAKK